MLAITVIYISTINNGGNNPHSISVPASTAQLKVMLYWNDPAAAVFASQTLVNDLDLEYYFTIHCVAIFIGYNSCQCK